MSQLCPANFGSTLRPVRKALVIEIAVCRRTEKATGRLQQDEEQASLDTCQDEEPVSNAAVENVSVPEEDIRAEPEDMQIVHLPVTVAQKEDSELPSSSQEEAVPPSSQAEGDSFPQT